MATGYYFGSPLVQHMVTGTISNLNSLNKANKVAWLIDQYAVGLDRDWHPDGLSGYSESDARTALAFAIFEIASENIDNPYDLLDGHFTIWIGPSGPITLGQAYLAALSETTLDNELVEKRFDIILADETNENWTGFGYANFVFYNPDEDGDGYSENQGDCDDNDPTINPETVAKGDINIDNSLDLHDLILSMQVLVGSQDEEPLCLSADINKNGKVGKEEIIFLLQVLSGLRVLQ